MHCIKKKWLSIYQHDKYNIWEFESKNAFIFSNLVFMSSWNFKLSWAELEKSFIISDQNADKQEYNMQSN